MTRTNGRKNFDLSAKKYYSIGEVAEIVGLSVEVLRKWERDFPSKIKPMRTKGDTRLYRSHDIEQIQMIKRMREIEGRTIEGVHRALSNNPGQEEVKQEVIGRLNAVRHQLQNIVDELETLQNNTGWNVGTKKDTIEEKSC